MATYVVNCCVKAEEKFCQPTPLTGRFKRKSGDTMRTMIVAASVAVASMCFPLNSLAAEKVMPVEWYRAEENTQALEAKLKECREKPELREKDKNCQNAADASVTKGSFGKVKEPAIPKF